MVLVDMLMAKVDCGDVSASLSFIGRLSSLGARLIGKSPFENSRLFTYSQMLVCPSLGGGPLTPQKSLHLIL